MNKLPAGSKTNLNHLNEKSIFVRFLAIGLADCVCIHINNLNHFFNFVYVSLGL